jgi:L-ascorbate metabolism protein UlaG (beta-lactamase superfamily)
MNGLIRAAQSGDAFLEDVRAGRERPGVRLWWLGQSGFLVQSDGRHLLIDPYLSDSLTKKYAQTDKPHVRMTERVVDPARLDFIDVATSSHNHTDHLDAETLKPLRAANPGLQFVIPEANRTFIAERLGVPPEWPLGLNDGESVEAEGFRFHAVPAAHEQVDRDAAGRCLYLGYVIETGGVRIYHSGDCMLYDGIADRIAPFAVDLALLPVNGSAPERRVAGNFSGREAAWLAREIGARLAVPMHYDMFTFNTASPDEFVAESRRLGVRTRVLRAGERLDLAAGREL